MNNTLEKQEERACIQYPHKSWRRQYLSKILSGVARLLFRLKNIHETAIGVTHYLRLRYADFSPRTDDIFIVTCPRSGTTWMQNILYQLTTDGNVENFVLDEFSPYFEYPYDAHRQYEDMPSPRIFKSHLPYGYLPTRVGKFIYIARDGRDVAISYFHTHLQEKEMTFAQFFDRFLNDQTDWRGGWFNHVRGWYEHRDDPNILFLKYEDLQRDLEGIIQQIINFCGLTIEPERLPAILERSSFEFMKAHQMHYTPGFLPNTHIRQGKTKSWVNFLGSEQNEHYMRMFEQRLGRLGMRFD